MKILIGLKNLVVNSVVWIKDLVLGLVKYIDEKTGNYSILIWLSICGVLLAFLSIEASIIFFINIIYLVIYLFVFIGLWNMIAGMYQNNSLTA